MLSQRLGAVLTGPAAFLVSWVIDVIVALRIGVGWLLRAAIRRM